MDQSARSSMTTEPSKITQNLIKLSGELQSQQQKDLIVDKLSEILEDLNQVKT